MNPGRLNALTDGVIAIVLTIMVLDLRMPASPTAQAVIQVMPLFGAYVLAFINIALYWNNHHHLMQSSTRVTGHVLWANMGLLFWLSLVPLVIRWIDEQGITSWPVAFYAVILTFCTISYQWLEWALIRADGSKSSVRQALGSRVKERLSLLFLLMSIPCAFVSAYAAIVLLIAVSGTWLVPDRRFERLFS